MSAEKKTRPTAATVEQVETGAGLDRSTTSQRKNTTPSSPGQVVSDFLGIGEKNGRTMKELREILNWDSRSIRAEIERERRAGSPILSGQCGYWICGSQDEAQVFCRSMCSRAKQIMMTVRAVERSTGISTQNVLLPGQCDLWDGDGRGGYLE